MSLEHLRKITQKAKERNAEETNKSHQQYEGCLKLQAS